MSEAKRVAKALSERSSLLNCSSIKKPRCVKKEHKKEDWNAKQQHFQAQNFANRRIKK